MQIEALSIEYLTELRDKVIATLKHSLLIADNNNQTPAPRRVWCVRSQDASYIHLNCARTGSVLHPEAVS